MVGRAELLFSRLMMLTFHNLLVCVLNHSLINAHVRFYAKGAHRVERNDAVELFVCCGDLVFQGEVNLNK